MSGVDRAATPANDIAAFQNEQVDMCPLTSTRVTKHH